MALAESYSGAKSAAQKTIVEAVDLTRQLNDPARLATAQLAQAVVALLAGDSQAASSYALQAKEVFTRLDQSASEWQALLIAAQASQNLGDKNRAREYAMQGKRHAWPSSSSGGVAKTTMPTSVAPTSNDFENNLSNLPVLFRRGPPDC